MPIPKRRSDEDKTDFLSRCMADPKMNEEYPDSSQRYAVCNQNAKGSQGDQVKDAYYENTFGYTEELTEDNFEVPNHEDYVSVDEVYFDEEECEEIDIALAKPGLWENIRKKKEREGKNYKPAKPGDPDRPTPEQIKKAQSLQYGKPPKNDPRKTPAPKKDQKKGSKKNKPDSAKDDKGKITLSKNTEDRLKSLVTKHNSKDKGSKVTLGMLKAVYRRGAGAFSTSHHPNMSRDGWAMARVNAFLYLMRNGRPSNPNYKQDNDLLPKSHPRSSKAEDQVQSQYKYKDIETNEVFLYDRIGVYRKNGRVLTYIGKANDESYMQVTQIKKMSEQLSMLAKIIDNVPVEFEEWAKDKLSKAEHFIQAIFDSVFYSKKPDETEKENEEEGMTFELFERDNAPPEYGAEYQGRKVQLGKPFRTPKGPKKFSVYVKNDKGNVVKVNFGDPNMKIKKNIPERRKSFRARHNCDNPGPRWKARYWSCRAW